MHRFNFARRVRRCRNVRAVNGRGFKRGFGDLCELYRPPEVCEVTFEPGVSARQRAYVLDRDDLFCQMCGLAPGDIDDLTERKAEFHVEFVANGNFSGKEELSNLRTLCSTCNQGAKNITTEKPTAIWLLSQVRRAGHDEQLTVLKWLREKFKA